jgi:hypothetical protein
MLLRKSDFSNNIGQPRTSPSGLLCPLTPAADIRRMAGIIYEKALRALHELPGQIARAEPQSITRWGKRAVRPRAATGLETRLLLEFRLLRVSDLDQSLGILSILHQECGEGRRVRGSRHDSLLI